MEYGITLLIVFVAGYIVGRRHAGGGTRRDPEGRRRWRMRADNNVPRRPATRPSSRATPSRGGGGGRTAGSLMDRLNIESLVGTMPGAVKQMIRAGDRAGAAKALQAAWPDLSEEVTRAAVDTWATRNGL